MEAKMSRSEQAVECYRCHSPVHGGFVLYLTPGGRDAEPRGQRATVHAECIADEVA